jgi:tripartite-type tricarboxylate transporter receptor subunit TctC
MTTNPHVMKSATDPIKEFRPISGGSSAIAVIAVNDSVPARNLNELIDYAKKNPGKLSYGTPGVGSPYHIGVEYIKKLSGIDMVHVPFQGGGPLLNAILGNHVPVGIASTSTFAGAVSSGKVSLVATGEAAPSDMAPSVAPIAETFQAIEIPTWVAFFAPAGTPERIVKILNEKIVTILNEPATKDRLRKLGQIASPSSPEELQATVKKESDYWAKVVPLSGVTLQK